MEGKSRLQQRTSQVVRRLVPTRLQDDLLAAVYDRLLDASSRAPEFATSPGSPSSNQSPPEAAGWPTQEVEHG